MNNSNRKKDYPPTVFYTSEPLLRHPVKLFSDMCRDLKASKELSWRLLVRNLSSQYRQTIFSYLWVFLPAIATTLLWTFLNSYKILDVQETAIPYPVYILTGTLLWQGFVDALNSPLRVVTSSRSVLTKINFPREALIFAGLGEVLFNFTIRLVLLVVVFVWFDIDIPTTIIFVPVGILSIMMLGLVIGILLTPMGVLFGDVQRGLNVITTLWFFLTPIVYPPPTQWPASLLSQLNPVSPLLVTTREWMTTGSASHYSGFLLVTFVSLLLLIAGWFLYRLSMPHLIERMGA